MCPLWCMCVFVVCGVWCAHVKGVYVLKVCAHFTDFCHTRMSIDIFILSVTLWTSQTTTQSKWPLRVYLIHTVCISVCPLVCFCMFPSIHHSFFSHSQHESCATIQGHWYKQIAVHLWVFSLHSNNKAHAVSACLWFRKEAILISCCVHFVMHTILTAICHSVMIVSSTLSLAYVL